VGNQFNGEGAVSYLFFMMTSCFIGYVTSLYQQNQLCRVIKCVMKKLERMIGETRHKVLFAWDFF